MKQLLDETVGQTL